MAASTYLPNETTVASARCGYVMLCYVMFCFALFCFEQYTSICSITFAIAASPMLLKMLAAIAVSKCAAISLKSEILRESFLLNLDHNKLCHCRHLVRLAKQGRPHEIKSSEVRASVCLLDVRECDLA